MNVTSTVLNDSSINGIHYEVATNNLYIASYEGQSIYIYNTNDEITFTKEPSINTSYNLVSITINMDKIYTGSSNGTILVYNKTSYDLIETKSGMCPNYIDSVKIHCNSCMIYSCFNPPMVNIIETNGTSSSILLNGTFKYAHESIIDSHNRLWVGGYNGFAILV